MSNTWVNGKQTNTISILDRGFSYGDGLFTTIKVIDGQCQLLAQHINRLEQGAERLSITPIDLASLTDDLIQKAKVLKLGVLKVIITRGEGKRGYSSIGCDSPTTVVIEGNLPDYQTWQQNGIKLGVSNIALGINPLTAGIKHLNRLEQVLIKQDIDKHQWTDALILDFQGLVVETSMANIFWRIENCVYTPNLDFSGVNGLMRQQVINIINDNEFKYFSNYHVIEGRFTLSDIIKADEVFITNCLMGLVPILSIDDAAFSIGELTKKLSQTLLKPDQAEHLKENS